ncbi:hypothetical protein MIR68_005285 [Amoeboaphelidium protococcarum]|nr:hypothetical protein MIR68_005285 [Amoeboaphelidium protococcarum]
MLRLQQNVRRFSVKNPCIFSESLRMNKAQLSLLEERIINDFPSLHKYNPYASQNVALNDQPPQPFRFSRFGQIYPGSDCLKNAHIFQKDKLDNGVLNNGSVAVDSNKNLAGRSFAMDNRCAVEMDLQDVVDAFFFEKAQLMNSDGKSIAVQKIEESQRVRAMNVLRSLLPVDTIYASLDHSDPLRFDVNRMDGTLYPLHNQKPSDKTQFELEQSMIAVYDDKQKTVRLECSKFDEYALNKSFLVDSLCDWIIAASKLIGDEEYKVDIRESSSPSQSRAKKSIVDEIPESWKSKEFAQQLQ